MNDYNFSNEYPNMWERQLPSASTLPGYPTMPTEPVMPSTATLPKVAVAPPTLTNIGYTQAFLRTKIGRKVRIEFLIGTNTFVDRGGILVDVGISYVVLRDTETNNLVMGDLYSIKFVTFFA